MGILPALGPSTAPAIAMITKYYRKRILPQWQVELVAPGARSGAREELRVMVDKPYAGVLFVGFLVLIAMALGNPNRSRG